MLNAVRKVEAELGAGFDQCRHEWIAQVEYSKAVEEHWRTELKRAVKNGEVAPPMPSEAVAPPEPTPPRILVTDTTPEALTAVLAANPRGVMSSHDELKGWLESFERYNQGSSRAMWVEAFGARPFCIDRVRLGGPLKIAALSVSVFGTTQPDVLAKILCGGDDGLTSRFLWFWPEPLPPAQPRAQLDAEFAPKCFRQLLRLGWADEANQPAVLKVDREGVETLDDFRRSNYRVAQSAGGLLASAYGKAPGLVLRLALILEHLWWSAVPTQSAPAMVTRKAILAAVLLWDRYFEPMAMRVYGDAALSPADRNAATLARRIRSEKADRINLREVRRTWGLPGLRESNAMTAAAVVLIEAGVLIAEQPGNSGGGRKPLDYIVNPRFLEG